jgi:hypothetical protein
LLVVLSLQRLPLPALPLFRLRALPRFVVRAGCLVWLELLLPALKTAVIAVASNALDRFLVVELSLLSSLQLPETPPVSGLLNLSVWL